MTAIPVIDGALKDGQHDRVSHSLLAKARVSGVEKCKRVRKNSEVVRRRKRRMEAHQMPTQASKAAARDGH